MTAGGRVLHGAVLWGVVLMACAGPSGEAQPPPCDPADPGCSATDASPVLPPPGADGGSADGGSSDGGSSQDAGTPPDGGSAGATLWLAQSSEPQHEVAAGVEVGPGGSVFSVAVHGVEHGYSNAGRTNLRIVLSRSAANGRPVWTKSFRVRPPPPVGGIELDATASPHIALSIAGGAVFVAGEIEGEVNFGGGPLRTGSFLARFTPDGAHVWSQSLPAGARALSIDADTSGNAYLGLLVEGASTPDGCSPLEGFAAKYASSGTLVWMSSVGGPQCQGFRADVSSIAVDSTGTVAVGGSFSGELVFGSQRYPTSQPFSPYLAAFAASGRFAWFKGFSEANGYVTSVDVSARGTVVATGILAAGNAIQWGTTRLQAGDAYQTGFLLVAEANAAPRWVKDVGYMDQPVLAVEPAGSVVVAGLSRSWVDPANPGVDPLNNPRLFASRYNLAGDFLWTRTYRRGEGPPDLFAEEVVDVAAFGDGTGSAVLTGQFSHPEDFGIGLRTPALTDVFLLRLAP
jgi:hypothetical protein